MTILVTGRGAVRRFAHSRARSCRVLRLNRDLAYDA
jgi:hypothetical protein